MYVDPFLVDLWIACFDCSVAAHLGNWHLDRSDIGSEDLEEGVPIDVVLPRSGGPTVEDLRPRMLPMSLGHRLAFARTLEPFLTAHAARSDIRLHEARPEDLAEVVLAPPALPPSDRASVEFARLRALVVDPDQGRDAEVMLATAIHSHERDPHRRAQALADLASDGFAREWLAGWPEAEAYSSWGPDTVALHLRALELCHRRGDLVRALEQAREWSLRRELIPELLQGAMVALGDGNRSASERTSIYRPTRLIAPDVPIDLFRHGRIAEMPMPATPDGLEGDAWDFELLSLSLSEETLAQALAAADPARVDVALSLLRERVRLDPTSAGPAEPWLRPLLSDGRRVRAGVVATGATPLYLRALTALGGEAARPLLENAVQQSVAALRQLSDWTWRHYYPAATSLGLEPAIVPNILVALIADRNQPSETRVRARQSFETAPVDEVVAMGRRKADEAVLGVLRDPKESEEIKRRFRQGLPRWMPHRLDELRGDVIPRVETLPTMSVLRETHGAQLEAALRDLSALAGSDQIARLLAEAGANRSLEVETAIALIPHLLDFQPEAAAVLEPGLRMRLADPELAAPGFTGLIYVGLVSRLAASGRPLPQVAEVRRALAHLPEAALDVSGWVGLLKRLIDAFAADQEAVRDWMSAWSLGEARAPEAGRGAFRRFCALPQGDADDLLRVGVSAIGLTTDVGAKLEILGLLCDHGGAQTLAAAESGRLPAFGVPSIRWLRQVFEDEGVAEPRPNRRAVAERLVPADAAIAAIASADALDGTIAAIELLPGILALHPEQAAAARDVLRSRLSDTRASGGPRTSHVFTVMPAALDAFLRLADGSPATIEAALSRVIDDLQTAPWAARCFEAAAPSDWDRLADGLMAIVSDANESLYRRFGAWVALVEGGRAPHASASGLASRAGRTAPLLREAIEDAGADPEAVQRILRHPLAQDFTGR
jgi:hypothetical protein